MKGPKELYFFCIGVFFKHVDSQIFLGVWWVWVERNNEGEDPI